MACNMVDKERTDNMVIKRNILGEKIGSAFGTIEIILTDEELREAYNEYAESIEESVGCTKDSGN